ncbi:SDR family NAD(P)-dependent oxidoreductase [Actinoplanes couchii]|uniref:Oxidoreductase n=2 Tax=Actinoplanes couchii TaxID=403638 RepID=A0ABQ3XL42_9ACTN|nr:oxidoreductase [Actinoplanes couchii]
MKNRRVLVTGASSGIGAATARTLHQAGARVAAGARRTDRLTGDLRLSLDVTDEVSVRAAVDAVVTEFGGLDLVVNAAGIMPLGPVLGADVTDWRRCLDTNVLGLMLVTHAALPHLARAAGQGGTADIVNIASVGGRETFPGSSAYNASKWAVVGFSEALRKEISPAGVRVSLVEPGFTDTELPASITDDTIRASIEDLVAGQKNLDSDEVAAAIAYITGQPAHVLINQLQVRPVSQL